MATAPDLNSSNGWIDWPGGECPVPAKTEVEIRLEHESGKTWNREGSDRADWFDHLGWWSGRGSNWRIIAYRIVEGA